MEEAKEIRPSKTQKDQCIYKLSETEAICTRFARISTRRIIKPKGEVDTCPRP